MGKKDYIILVGIAAAAGSFAGMLSDRKKPAEGGLLGAAAAVVAASVAAGVYQHVTSEKVPYYSSQSSLYDELDPV